MKTNTAHRSNAAVVDDAPSAEAEARLEAAVDRAVMRRLSTDSDYNNAENAEQQAEREQQITDQEYAAISARFVA